MRNQLVLIHGGHHNISESQHGGSSPYFLELCERCGCTFGSHYGNDCGDWPYNYCPGHEGQEDWKEGPGTVFKESGKYDVKKLRNRA
jgi:hypothetical protein